MLIKKVDFSFIPTLVVCANWGLKAVAVRKHLERNRKDKDSKFRLILIESRIHRLSRYYKTVGVLPPTWRYESATASTLVA
jgi:small subunit ribosomal protein S13e